MKLKIYGINNGGDIYLHPKRGGQWIYFEDFNGIGWEIVDRNENDTVVRKYGFDGDDYFDEEVKPVEIHPEIILNKGKIDNKAIAALNDPGKYLISMPGSEFKLKFIFPEKGINYELFLYSKGYYLEWMRKHWLKDKDLLKLKQMVDNPKKYLKVEAKNYKLYELQMEHEFWNSKIDTKTFSYDEN